MHFLTDDQAIAGLRLMKTIALADGELSEKEIGLLDAAASALGLPETFRAADVQTIEEGASLPDALLVDNTSPLLRERAIQAAMLMSMIDGSVSEPELALLRSFARTLKIDEPRLLNLEQLAHGHLRLMWIDLARKSFARPIFEEALRKRGLLGVLSIALPMVGLGSNPDLTRRYNDLGKLPNDTLGYAYWKFIVDHELGFPGEGVVAEEGVWHDVSHVLGEYDTTPEGEVQVVSFIAGYRREDPFFWLFTIALQFHLGIKVSPYSPGLKGHFDPELVFHAVKRGAQMTRDLSVNYDPWDDFPQNLNEVRTKYNVVP